MTPGKCEFCSVLCPKTKRSIDLTKNPNKKAVKILDSCLNLPIIFSNNPYERSTKPRAFQASNLVICKWRCFKIP